jgi:hypothetical protein
MGTMGHEGAVVAWENTTEAVVSESPLNSILVSTTTRQCGLIEEKKRGRRQVEMWEMQRILVPVNTYSYHVSRRNAGTDD